MIDRRPGRVVVRVRGKGARALFEGEVGGHRWQRIPETEKRGRVHSSTITVAVLDEAVATELVIPESDLEWFACRSPGKGGQNVQKTDSAVQVKHLPTGLFVRSHEQRSYHQNKAVALARLRERLLAAQRRADTDARAAERRAQVGSGMRGDKRRTIRVQDDQVIDHETGRTWRYRDYERGNW
ncbi:MAG TPA: peptide chain release factor-like protein [Kofleriaceae bacterium]|nr:peptide chain release factor-like protein [Kofleriaceae bacterium]